MIDLHMHTKYSDGADEVCDLLKKAEGLNLKVIAVTDHNTCLEYGELNNPEIRKIFSGKILTGVELNTKVNSHPIEILGYNIDTDKMQELIEKTYVSQEERCKIEAKRLYEKCIAAGVNLPDDFIDNYDGSVFVSEYLHKFIEEDEHNRSLFDEDAVKTTGVFYRKYMSNPSSKFFVNMDDCLPDFETAANIVREAGGMVFLPHIYEYREHSMDILDYILKNYKIDGIECYYRNFEEWQTEFLLNKCKEYNLYVSGGSDYHGIAHPGVEMGTGEGKLSVPDDIISDWAEKFI